VPDEESTRLDRLVNWCKNNRFIVWILFAALLLGGAAELKKSLAELGIAPKNETPGPSNTPITQSKPEPSQTASEVRPQPSPRPAGKIYNLRCLEDGKETKCSVYYSRERFIVAPAGDWNNATATDILRIYKREQDDKTTTVSNYDIKVDREKKSFVVLLAHEEENGKVEKLSFTNDIQASFYAQDWLGFLVEVKYADLVGQQ